MPKLRLRRQAQATQMWRRCYWRKQRRRLRMQPFTRGRGGPRVGRSRATRRHGLIASMEAWFFANKARRRFHLPQVAVRGIQLGSVVARAQPVTKDCACLACRCTAWTDRRAAWKLVDLESSPTRSPTRTPQWYGERCFNPAGSRASTRQRAKLNPEQ